MYCSGVVLDVLESSGGYLHKSDLVCQLAEALTSEDHTVLLDDTSGVACLSAGSAILAVFLGSSLVKLVGHAVTELRGFISGGP